MKEKILSIVLALFLVIGLIPTGVLTERAEAAGTGSTYFREQLSADSAARMFYDAIDTMNKEGILKTGTGALDLTEKFGTKAAEFCAMHANGDINLMSEYGAGRDAFYADHPDIFYVDFSALTVRVTESAGVYHLYLGAGRYPTYYTTGFSSEADVEAALKEYNAELAKLIEAGSAKSDPREQVIAVHDYLTHHVTYRDELAVAPENMGFVRTAYGALVKQEGVCESYTRAFKAAMDALGIPCVMVSGVYRHSDKILEAHIWNEVCIDGRWYAVDVTMDDPVNPKKGQYDKAGEDGYENRQYLLVGEDVMNVHHIKDGAMSPGGFEFTYPPIETDFETITDEESPLKVRFRSEAYDEEILQGGVYYVSYMGMNATEMKKNGYYLLMRYRIYDVDDGWIDTEWHYYMPEVYAQGDSFGDVGNETKFEMPHVEYVEFGVTLDPAPEVRFNEVPDMFFHGDTTLLLADSGLLHNEDGTYRAAPASLHGEPAYNKTSISLGETVHLVAYFNDYLVTPEVYETWCKTERYDEEGYKEAVRSATEKDFSLEAHLVDNFVIPNRDDKSAQYQTIKNVQISFIDVDNSYGSDVETKIEFDYTTSNQWLDDNVLYVFYISGLVGAYSGKTPGSFGWAVQAPCAVCAYRSQGFDYNAFAKPVLVADEDLSMKGWTDTNGEVWEGTKWDDDYKSRLMLVVEDSSPREANELEDMVEETGEDVLSASTYNINLSLCKKMWANLGDGMSVRIQLGFPVGYGPEDAGVTFKAYHFIKDKTTGEILGLEEIPCVITPYGLLVTVNSFSPFAICAVEKTEDEPAEKTVALMSSVGGSVSADGGNMITLKPNESAKITVTPEAGYIIDTVEVSGAASEYAGEQSGYSFEVSYDDVKDGSAIVSAVFVTKTVAEEELGDAVIPTATAPEAKYVELLTDSEVQTSADGSVTLELSENEPSYSYSWYKVGEDGDVFVGSGSRLVLSGVDKNGLPVDNSGEYYCVVTATAGASSASSRSETVTVSNSPVKPAKFRIESSPAPLSGSAVSVTEGEKVVLSVYKPVDGYKYTWYADGEEVGTGDTFTVSDGIGGVYSCAAENDAGTTLSENSIGIIFTPPVPEIDGEDNRNVVEGEDVVFKIKNADEAKYGYTWYKIGDDGEDKKVGEGPSVTLSGSDIGGMYYCEVTNKATGASAKSKVYNVNVQEADPDVPYPDEFEIDGESEVEIEEGESAVLSVKNPQDGITYKWYRETVEEGEVLIGEGVSISVSKAGEYFCAAYNSENERTDSSNSVTVTVVIKQSKPTEETKPVHRHTFAGYGFNDGYHWLICSICGQFSDMTPHVFNGGNTCLACGYTRQTLGGFGGFGGFGSAGGSQSGVESTDESADEMVIVEAPTEGGENAEDEVEG